MNRQKEVDFKSLNNHLPINMMFLPVYYRNAAKEEKMRIFTLANDTFKVVVKVFLKFYWLLPAVICQ